MGWGDLAVILLVNGDMFLAFEEAGFGDLLLLLLFRSSSPEGTVASGTLFAPLDWSCWGDMLDLTRSDWFGLGDLPLLVLSTASGSLVLSGFGDLPGLLRSATSGDDESTFVPSGSTASGSLVFPRWCGCRDLQGRLRSASSGDESTCSARGWGDSYLLCIPLCPFGSTASGSLAAPELQGLGDLLGFLLSSASPRDDESTFPDDWV